MASKYFSGTAPTSYLPPGFMESATAPGRYYAEAMGSIGKAVGAGLAKRNQRKKDKAYFDFIERMGETPVSRTETIPGVEMRERGRPLTDEASGDYFNEQMDYREGHIGHLEKLDDLEQSQNTLDRIAQYAGSKLSESHPIHEVLKMSDRMLLDEQENMRSTMSSNLNSMLVQTMDEGAGLEPFGISAAELQRVNAESMKWLKGQQKGTKDIIAEHEANLDDFMAGVDRNTGEKLMEAVPTETEVNVPLSLKERREIVTSDLAGMARSMGRERFKEARAEVDKLFPRQPELGVTDQGGALIITEDGAYKAAMAKPKLQGNSMFEQLSEASQKLVPGLMDDVRKDPSIAKYVESYTALNIMKGAAGLQSGAGDLALVTKFMKALDPESVVRESEVAQAQNTIPAYKQIQLIIKGLGDDEKLLDDQRDQLVAAAERLVSKGREMADFRINDYREKGSLMGIPDKLFIPKLPGGETKAVGGQDLSNAKHWDPVKEEYIIPNAPDN